MKKVTLTDVPVTRMPIEGVFNRKKCTSIVRTSINPISNSLLDDTVDPYYEMTCRVHPTYVSSATNKLKLGLLIAPLIEAPLLQRKVFEKEFFSLMREMSKQRKINVNHFLTFHPWVTLATNLNYKQEAIDAMREEDKVNARLLCCLQGYENVIRLNSSGILNGVGSEYVSKPSLLIDGKFHLLGCIGGKTMTEELKRFDNKLNVRLWKSIVKSRLDLEEGNKFRDIKIETDFDLTAFRYEQLDGHLLALARNKEPTAGFQFEKDGFRFANQRMEKEVFVPLDLEGKTHPLEWIPYVIDVMIEQINHS